MSREHNIMDNASRFEKLKELNAYFDKQLQLWRNSSFEQTKHLRLSALIKKWLAKLCGLALLMVLPFFVLIRTSVFLYGTYQLNGWLALMGGAAAMVSLLLIYALIFSRHMMTEKIVNKRLVYGVSLTVLVYCCYGLLHFSSMNVKNQEVRSYYHALHPILRITLTTTTLADQQMIITDTRRIPDDYMAMGLPVNERSLHYVQESGYIHAVDIRTRGRAGWKNWLTQGMFQLAGLRVRRHIGTADHLHVFLPVND